MHNIRIKELALELKLSVSTISKALRDSHEISEETKQRVLEAARRLNYVPNPYASSLRGRKSKNIAVVIPEVADSFFSLAINGIESVAKQKGYHVLIYLTHENFENEQAILREFQGGRVDGVLMSVSGETSSADHISDLVNKGVPLVFFDRAFDSMPAAKVVTDDYDSGYKATEHLLKQGCKDIAFLAISKSLSISNKRMDGYLQALNDHNITTGEKNIVHCSNDVKKNIQSIRKLLKQSKRPDGILASVEKLTTPVYQVCQELKIKIPGSLKIVCFSNLEIASILNPSLTTITQPAFDMGKAAAEILLKTLGKNNYNASKEEIVIASKLVVRGSTK